MIGKKVWVFADGDLPPKGDVEPVGHEALMIVNSGDESAAIELTIFFEDSEPYEKIEIDVPAKRVRCFRMDEPIGKEQFEIPFGQFAVLLKSSIPVVALYGRLDRRENMAYYPISGFSTDSLD